MENEIIVNGVEYVRKDSVKEVAEKLDGMPYCIIRTYSAGVFAGYLESREGKEAVIRNSRRIWYWDGACSLSQLAMEGTKKPNECKFAVAVDRTTLTEVIELIDCTQQAKESIEGVEEWIC